METLADNLGRVANAAERQTAARRLAEQVARLADAAERQADAGELQAEAALRQVEAARATSEVLVYRLRAAINFFRQHRGMAGEGGGRG